VAIRRRPLSKAEKKRQHKILAERSAAKRWHRRKRSVVAQNSAGDGWLKKSLTLKLKGENSLYGVMALAKQLSL